MTALMRFRSALDRSDILESLRGGLIGRDMPFASPYGTQRLLYADYVASGRALRQVEEFVATEVLPWYANSHTEASLCGETITRMREEARATIGRLLGAGPDCHVIFAGSGATAGLNRIARLLQIEERVRAGERVTVLHGPYEHHSNILPWRESGAAIRTVRPGAGGGIDLAHLEQLLQEVPNGLVIGSFSAASNVTGVLTEPDPVTRILKRHGALAIWDYAGGAPYLAMDMGQGETAKDAIVFSTHKFPGGPGASGVAVIRDSLAGRGTPTAPGGGTVTFVSATAAIRAQPVPTARKAGGSARRHETAKGTVRPAAAHSGRARPGSCGLSRTGTALRKCRAVAAPCLSLLPVLPGAGDRHSLRQTSRSAAGQHFLQSRNGIDVANIFIEMRTVARDSRRLTWSSLAMPGAAGEELPRVVPEPEDYQ
ncbi:aminotransferase class V-fold PLP-dependent enzyme [Mangrovicoccus ximenensis]|uniref:aminotransferase class V-fold PLP-dependent enzyme n=1 Tax=Mangrovicoccus ximenensis TaxID=1911570 RepID=UPI000D33A234|nr:aminotransferase class V-fold PLP-dependent enzyme [Mangrovicoccus ximenensis]